MTFFSKAVPCHQLEQRHAIRFCASKRTRHPQKKRIHPIFWVIFAVILYFAYQHDEENLRRKRAGLPPLPLVNHVQDESVVHR